MAAFSDYSNILGYDIMSPMYKDITGNSGSDPFAMDLGEGGPWLLSSKQAQTLGQFDPSVFDGIDFTWQGTGKGNTGTLSAMRDGKSIGSWSQKSSSLGETLGKLALLAGGAFGGLGLAGFGPISGLQGLFGGAGSTGAAAGTGATSASTGGLVYPSINAGTASLTSPGAMSLYNMPAAGSFIGGAGAGAAAYPSISGASAADSTLLNMPGAGAAGTSAPGTLSSYVDKLIGGVKDMKGGNLMRAASGLMSLYSGIQQRNDAKRLMGQLTSLGGPGSAYEQTLRKQLERRDAAAGRRSQYGPREVELQAKLAELMTRNSGSLAALMQQKQGGTDAMLRSLFFGGKSLLDLFGG